MGQPANTVERMIREHVEKTPTCWLWHGPVALNGYAKTAVLTESQSAHRVFYEHFKGAAPDGYFVRQSCRERLCVNPDHLEAMPPRESILLGDGPAAQNARKHSCLRGHALSGGNLYTTPDGRRQCRKCNALRSRKSKGARSCAP